MGYRSRQRSSIALLQRMGFGLGAPEEPAGVREEYAPGDVIAGRYRVLDAKRGGFGCVYICKAVGHATGWSGDLVALKTPLRAENVGRFCDEAANWISLGAHPNLVYAYYVTRIGDRPFVVMEYIADAVTLAAEIASKGASWRLAVTAGLGVARGLAHCQRVAHLAHGDIKPANILVTPEGVAKVIDIGLSLRGVKNRPWSNDDEFCGTDGFIAPEMVRRHGGRSQAADVFAFGVTLFQAATGRWPFPHHRAGRGRVPATDPRQYVRDLPASLAGLINECLRANPAKRPSSFARLAERLAELHRALLGEEPRLASPPNVPDREVDALVNVAVSWLNLDEPERARAAALRAVGLEPGDSDARIALGSVHEQCEAYREALASYQVAHELDPDDITPMVSCARVQAKLGDAADARRWMDAALRVSAARAEYAPLDAISGLVVDALPPEQAREICDAILRDMPDAATTLKNRANLLRSEFDGVPRDRQKTT